MKSVLEAIDRLSQVLGLSVAHFYFVCALLTAYEVVLRYVFNAPTLWAFEVVMVVCACAWALSGGYVTMRRSHISITVLYQYTKGWVRWWLDLFIMIVSLASMLILAYSVWGLVHESFVHIERSGTSFNSPEPMIIKVALFTGVCVYAVQVMANLVRHFMHEGRPVHPELDAE